jgi:GNAT superfamily N-acetyltransferase
VIARLGSDGPMAATVRLFRRCITVPAASDDTDEASLKQDTRRMARSMRAEDIPTRSAAESAPTFSPPCPVELCRMVGLGEVCTHPDHRRKGFAGKCLEAAQRLIEEREDHHYARQCAAEWGVALNEGRCVSALHAASEAAALYERLGYVRVPVLKTVIPVERASVMEVEVCPLPEGWRVVRATPEDAPSLAAIQKTFTLRHGLVGVHIRTVEFWRTYVLGWKAQENVCLLQEREGDEWRSVAYCTALEKNGHVSLADFGHSLASLSAELFASLVREAVNDGPAAVVCPMAVFHGVRVTRPEPSPEASDSAWMYRFVTPSEEFPPDRHVVWDMDGF